MFATLGKFQIKSLLGSGAMGEVFLGVDPSLGREVAIKTILPSAAEGAEMKERFAREARAAGTLNHPNIVTVYEFGEDQGVMYIAMEYVPGSDLEELIVKRTLSRTEILEVLAQVCDGLDFAHQRHIVHRDIKPANIRVQREGKRLFTRVMDFGVARVGNSDMTSTGMVLGTVSYMAPEYIQTGRPDARSDLFAVGVILYEALSGRKPFAGDTAPTILYKIVNVAPEPLDFTHFEGISPVIRNVLDRSLDKDPEQRFQTAEEFAKALRAAKDPTWQGHATASGPLSLPMGAELTVNLRSLQTSREPLPSNQHSPRRLGFKMGWMVAIAIGVLAAGGVLAWNLAHPRSEGLVPPPVSVEAKLPSESPATSGSPQAPSKVEAPLSPVSPAAPMKPESPLESRPRENTGASKQAPIRRSSGENASSSPLQPSPPLEPQKPLAPEAPERVEPFAENIVRMYRQGRFAECRRLFLRARRQGLGRQLNNHPDIRQIFAEERRHPKVPSGLDLEH